MATPPHMSLPFESNAAPLSPSWEGGERSNSTTRRMWWFLVCECEQCEKRGIQHGRPAVALNGNEGGMGRLMLLVLPAYTMNNNSNDNVKQVDDDDDNMVTKYTARRAVDRLRNNNGGRSAQLLCWSLK